MEGSDKMGEPKPFASLSSGLLARKGGAKPAMRRQGINFPEASGDQTEQLNSDLGWNDMGYDTNPDHSAESADTVHHNPLAGAVPETTPAVKQQQDEIAAKLGTKIQPEAGQNSQKNAEPAPPSPLSISREVMPLEEHSAVVKAAKEMRRAPRKKSRPATKSRTRKAKAAFTLRLDAERHLRLRLATAMKNVSAQQLVTKAVDEYLNTIPELDELAERVPARKAL